MVFDNMLFLLSSMPNTKDVGLVFFFFEQLIILEVRSLESVFWLFPLDTHSCGLLLTLLTMFSNPNRADLRFV